MTTVIAQYQEGHGVQSATKFQAFFSAQNSRRPVLSGFERDRLGVREFGLICRYRSTNETEETVSSSIAGNQESETHTCIG